MAKNIFVSHNFNDRHVSDAVHSMLAEHEQDIGANVVFVENDVSYNGATAVDWEIEHVMEQCDAALFVLGEEHHNSPWLAKECEHALSKNIPIIVTSLPGESFDTPDPLEKQHCPVVSWESNELYRQMNQS